MHRETEESGRVKRWGTREDIALEYGYSTKTVDRYVDQKKLPNPVRWSKRCLRFDMDEVHACFERMKTIVKGPTATGGAA